MTDLNDLDLLDLIEESNSAYAATTRKLYRLERIESDIEQLIKRYKGKHDYITLSQVALRLQELLDAKP